MPTPVSALLHAATLVTAGIYLLLRLSPVLEFASLTLIVLTFLGALTAFLGGTMGLVQNDLKRVIAFSTMSQLGYMVYAIGISAYSISLYHLANHAFFKALLFLSAGSIIHALGDEQDLRKMGGLRKILNFTYVMMLLASISLMGLPFTTGFYSKEVILTLGYSSPLLGAGFGYWLCLISALFTTIYSVRLITSAFLVPSGGSKSLLWSVGTEKNKKVISSEPDLLMTIPLGILAIGSIGLGYFLSDMFALNSSFFSGVFFMLSTNVKTELMGGALWALSLTFVGTILGLIVNLLYPQIILIIKLRNLGYLLYSHLSLRYYMDLVYSQWFTKATIRMGFLTAKELDKGLGEFIGPTGLGQLLTNFSQNANFVKEEREEEREYQNFTGSPQLLSVTALSYDPNSVKVKNLYTPSSRKLERVRPVRVRILLYGQYFILSTCLLLGLLICFF